MQRYLTVSEQEVELLTISDTPSGKNYKIHLVLVVYNKINKILYACNLKRESPESFCCCNKHWFRKPVMAGDTLATRTTLVKLKKQFGITEMEGMAYVAGDVVCKGEFWIATGSE